MVDVVLELQDEECKEGVISLARKTKTIL